MDSLPTTPIEHEVYWRFRYPDAPYGYCVCGCGEETKASKQTDNRFGHVIGCPRYYLQGHAARNPEPEYLVTETGCWQWNRSYNGGGYGLIKTNTRKLMAHRVYYERKFGPMPFGYHAHHKCKNKGCVNPDHLQAISSSEHLKMERQRLTLIQVQTIELLLAQGFGLGTIARLYSVSASAIRSVRDGAYD